MVVASPEPANKSEKVQALELPIIDLSGERKEVSRLIVKACEEYGFFKVINHGVPADTVAKLEEESFNFFAKEDSEKQRAGPANPYGYGCNNIGFNGDVGEVEYLLFNANPLSIAQTSLTISNDPSTFSSTVSGYVEAVREVACEILDLMAEGLWVPDRSVFSKLIRAVDNDSLFRLNHYPIPSNRSRSQFVGFGEHSDPQILTILRSNDVGGLQICLEDGFWVPVSPVPTTALCVNVGDVLQAMTNGRFVSVRHRALINSSNKRRMSMAFFGAPPLHASITAPPQMVTCHRPSLFRPFTWAEFKKTTYSLRLGDSRLHLFNECKDDAAACAEGN